MSYSPTLRNDRYYVSVNDETTRKVIESVTDFNFLQANNYDTVKIVVESGIDNTGPTMVAPTVVNRQEKIIKTLKHPILPYPKSRDTNKSEVIRMEPTNEIKGKRG